MYNDPIIWHVIYRGCFCCSWDSRYFFLFLQCPWSVRWALVKPCALYLCSHLDEHVDRMWSRCQPQPQGLCACLCVFVCVCACKTVGRWRGKRWMATLNFVWQDLEPFYTRLHTNIHTTSWSHQLLNTRHWHLRNLAELTQTHKVSLSHTHTADDE